MSSNAAEVADNPFAGMPALQVLVTGGTGFIGRALVALLLAGGHGVTVLSRDPAKAGRALDSRVRCIGQLTELAATDRMDAVVNLAGAPVMGPRWSRARQAHLLASRVGTTEALLAWMRRAQRPPAVWVQASAIGFYGVRAPEEALTEASQPGQGFMARLCVAWENACKPVPEAGVRTVVLRLGVVLGKGGALPLMLLPYRLGFGGRLGSGLQVLSWIHLQDVLAVLARALAAPSMRGVYNAVAPQPVPQAEFARIAGRVLHRPVWLPLPAGPVRWLAGEMAQLFVDGQRVLPQRLQEEGYAFRFSGLEGALKDLTA